VDLGHTAVLGVPQRTGQGDDVEPKFMLRQGEVSLPLGA